MPLPIFIYFLNLFSYDNSGHSQIACTGNQPNSKHTSLTATRKWDTGSNVRTQEQQEMALTSQEVEQLESSGRSVFLISARKSKTSTVRSTASRLHKHSKLSKFEKPLCGFKNEKRRCTCLNGFSML